MDASESLVLKLQFHSFAASAASTPTSGALLEFSLAASPLTVSVGITLSTLLVEGNFTFLTSIVGFGLVNNGIKGAASSTLSSKFRIVRINDSSLVGTSRSRSSCKYINEL